MIDVAILNLLLVMKLKFKELKYYVYNFFKTIFIDFYGKKKGGERKTSM